MGTVSILDPSAGARPTNEKLINFVSEFPTASGGFRTLDASTFYLIGDDLNVGTDRFVLQQDTVVAGLDSSTSSLTYTGTGIMFTAVDTNNKITKLTLDCPNGSLFSSTSPVTPSVFQMVDCTVDSCDIIGVLGDLAATQLSNVAFNDIKTNGILFTGSHGVFTGQTDLVNLNGGVLLDLGTATFDAVDLSSSFVTVAPGTTMLSGAANSANITSGNIGSITGTRIFGAGTPLVGITIDDIRWNFQNNDDIQDTMPDAMLSLNSNTTETSIAMVDTPVKVTGTWIIERESFFSGGTTGRITFNGERDIVVPVDITTTIEAASGTNKDITIYLSLNGTIIANSGKTNKVSANDPKATSVLWQLTVTENDFLEIFLENNTDSVNLVCSSAILRVR